MRYLKSLPTKVKVGLCLLSALILTGSFVAWRSDTAAATIAYNSMELMNKNTSGQYSGTVGALGQHTEASVSKDGDIVVFSTEASDMVSGDTNGAIDMFVKNRSANTLTRMVQPSGAQWTTHQYDGMVSGNGKFVTYNVNLFGAYLYNISTATTTSLGSAYYAYGVSDDGRLIVMVKISGSNQGVYVYDTRTLTYKPMSVLAGTSTVVTAGYPSMSCDGRFVSFYSGNSGIVAGDINGVTDVYLVDRVTDEVKNITINGNGNSLGQTHLSCDGKSMGFQSSATNLVGSDTNGVRDAFVYDIDGQTIQRVNVDSSGNQSSAAVRDAPVVSDDGAYATFTSTAADLGYANASANENAYIRDLKNGTTEIVSALVIGGVVTQQNNSRSAVVSANGNVVVFGSDGHFTNDPSGSFNSPWRYFLASTGNNVCN